MTIESYSVPGSIAEAAQVLNGGGATILAGGTDLRLQAASGVRELRSNLVNIRRIEEMRGIVMQGDTFRIGALTTVSEILESEVLAADAPVLTEAADKFASPQIRNAATLGGNLCNASPAGDMCIPLLVLDARVELTRWVDGAVLTRQVPLSEFFTGPGSTVMQDAELLTAVEFDKPGEGFSACFFKSGPRPALEISIVSLGLGAVVEGRALKDVRVALGAVAPTPLRALKTEALLEGRQLNDDLLNEAVEAICQEVSPINDVRASAWYRKHLAGVYIRRALSHVSGN